MGWPASLPITFDPPRLFLLYAAVPIWPGLLHIATQALALSMRHHLIRRETYLLPHRDPTAEIMPAVDEASHAALASTLTTPADRRHQDLLDQPEARSASFARDTGGSDDLLSITDSDSLDLDKFDFTPFLCDRQNPADTLGRLATAEEIFSFLTGPSPAAQPSESPLPAYSLRLCCFS